MRLFDLTGVSTGSENWHTHSEFTGCTWCRSWSGPRPPGTGGSPTLSMPASVQMPSPRPWSVTAARRLQHRPRQPVHQPEVYLRAQGLGRCQLPSPRTAGIDAWTGVATSMGSFALHSRVNSTVADLLPFSSSTRHGTTHSPGSGGSWAAWRSPGSSCPRAVPPGYLRRYTPWTQFTFPVSATTAADGPHGDLHLFLHRPRHQNRMGHVHSLCPGIPYPPRTACRIFPLLPN